MWGHTPTTSTEEWQRHHIVTSVKLIVAERYVWMLGFANCLFFYFIFFHAISAQRGILSYSLFSATKEAKCVRTALLRESNCRINALLACSLLSLFGSLCLCTYYSLFLKKHWLIPLLTQAKAQVLHLLLSHWVGQWIKLLYVSTAALCLPALGLSSRNAESLRLRGVVHMLASSYFPRMRQYREFAENEFSGNLSLVVSSSRFQPVENYLCWKLLFSCLSQGVLFMCLFFFCCHCASLQAPLDHSSHMSLSDSGFEPGGKKNFLQLTDKDGQQPQVVSVSDTRWRVSSFLSSF